MTLQAVPLEWDADALSAVRLVLADLAETIAADIDGVADGLDPEQLHELRVAVRRTRALLAQCKGVLPAEVRAGYRAELAWLGQVTGPARDLDVQLLQWADAVASLTVDDVRALEPVRAELEQRRQAARRELGAALRGPTMTGLLAGWRRWLGDPTVVAATFQPIGPFVAHRIERAQREVLRCGRAITPGSPALRVHELRKEAKKLRYLLECFGGLFPADELERVVDTLKALQDDLGSLQDVHVQREQLRRLADDLRARPDTGLDALLALGRLRTALRHRGRRERAELPERFAAYDRKANRRALQHLLRGPGQGPDSRPAP